MHGRDLEPRRRRRPREPFADQIDRLDRPGGVADPDQGQQAGEEVQDEFGQLEKQIKDTIRDKPLTAVAGAIALGYILAVVSR